MIVLHILAVIGKILLVILLVILILLLCLLFVPFRYKGSFEKKGDQIRAGGTVSWLFHFLHFRVRYESGLRYELYILGIPILKLVRRIRSRKTNGGETHEKNGRHGIRRKKPDSRSKTVHRPEQEDDETREASVQERTGEDNPESGSAREMQEEEKIREENTAGKKENEGTENDTGNAAARDGTGTAESDERSGEKRPGILQRAAAAWKRVRQKISGFFRGVREKLRRLRSLFRKIIRVKDLLESETFERARKVTLRHAGAILRSIRPRRIEGKLEFGFDDPAVTGEVLGVISMIYPVLPEKLEIIPYFTEQKLEADVRLRGRIILVVVIYHGLRIWFDRSVKAVIRRAKKIKDSR